MFDLFGMRGTSGEHTLAECLDRSSFDEKFEIDLQHDTVRSLEHVKNKYYIPVLNGKFSDLLSYSVRMLLMEDESSGEVSLTPEILEQLLESADPKGCVQLEYRQRMEDGSSRWVLHIFLTGEENGVPAGKIYLFIFDIQNQKDRASSRSPSGNLIHQDPLTDLLDGSSFIPAAAALAEQAPGPWCCLSIEVRHFDIFTAWMGREKADYVRSGISTVLKNLEADWQAVSARYSDESFAVFMRYDRHQIRQLYESIRDIISTFTNALGFLPAFGVYVLNPEEKAGLDMYRRARRIREKARNSYKEHIRYFETEQFDRVRENHQLLVAFRQALKQGDIRFYLQPLCSISTGQILGAEVLTRWFREDLSMIIPGEFVPFLEEQGFVTDLDKYIWESVCQWIRGLMDRGITPVPVSLNVSQMDLLCLDVGAYLYGLAQRYQIPVKYLKIELTESAFASDFDTICQAVTGMKKKGFQVLLDDFGSGYSSLNMLDKINTDVLKLDMAFIRKDTGLSSKNISIIESIISMSKTLRIPVVVEGVETEDQVDFLKDLGCMYAQGYYYYRPMPVEQFEALLIKPELVDYSGLRSRPTDLFHAREFMDETIFPNTVLNNILGPVAFYFQDRNGGLSITRFNRPFYDCIADTHMEGRTNVIQNYVVPEDVPYLERMLEDAYRDPVRGGECTVRFNKSAGGEFWYNMHLYFLRESDQGRVFYGKIAEANRMYRQAQAFYDTLRANAFSAMRIDLEQRMFYELKKERSFDDNSRGMDVERCLQLTSELHIPDEEQRKKFVSFFHPVRLRQSHQSGIYNETLTVDFVINGRCRPTRFSAYYIKFMPDQNDNVYIFTYPD